jgi:hypothetical protein
MSDSYEVPVFTEDWLFRLIDWRSTDPWPPVEEWSEYLRPLGEIRSTMEQES